MSTLPRTRSMSAASSSSSAASGSKERVRPLSLCETSWTKITGPDHRQNQLVRSPSQANNLCTTVPQSLVMQNLGGRHTPTRNSLRHSRMLVLSRNGQRMRDRRWSVNSLGRAGVLVVTAEILVGVMCLTLATWFLLWVPSLTFAEVPHYAGLPVFLAGVLGAILITCCQKRRQRSTAGIIKVILIAICCFSIVACICVCTFTAIHLSQLSSMVCHTQHRPVRLPSPSESETSPDAEGAEINAATASTPNRKSIKSLFMYDGDDEDDVEGSGLPMREMHAFEDYPDSSELEVETVTLQTVTVKIQSDILLNLTWCVCENHHYNNKWARTWTYPDLSCLEVNNLLPVLFVASCIVTAVGAVLSLLILYLLWSFRNSYYDTAKPHETRPFIFKRKLKNTSENNGSSVKVKNSKNQFT